MGIRFVEVGGIGRVKSQVASTPASLPTLPPSVRSFPSTRPRPKTIPATRSLSPSLHSSPAKKIHTESLNPPTTSPDHQADYTTFPLPAPVKEWRGWMRVRSREEVEEEEFGVVEDRRSFWKGELEEKRGLGEEERFFLKRCLGELVRVGWGEGVQRGEYSIWICEEREREEEGRKGGGEARSGKGFWADERGSQEREKREGRSVPRSHLSSLLSEPSHSLWRGRRERGRGQLERREGRPREARLIAEKREEGRMG